MRDEDRNLYAALETRLRAMGLGRVAKKVLRLVRPAIRLDLTRTEEAAIPVGTTKVGGSADLLPGVEWPGWHGGPLPFVAQVRLEEMAALDPEGDLPHQGVLSFFYADDDPESGFAVVDDPTAWRVLYSADATRLERQPLPDELALADGYHAAFPACAVTCSRRLTLPDAAVATVRALGLTNDEHRAYSDLVMGLSAGFEAEMDHRLLGYPYTLEPDPFLAGYLARNGIERPTLPEDPAGQERVEQAKAILQEEAKKWQLPIGDYHGPEDAARAIADLTASVDIASLHRALAGLEPTPPPPEYLAQMEELRRAAEEEWRLLLQVYSNGEAEMDWASGGVLHFGISRADLAARDFSRIWVNVDFV
jgi:uncharacterized protein YwqG